MIPSNVVVHQQSKVLELSYEGGATYRLPFELLRVLSPSAEVQGHGPGQETLQTGKRDVLISNLEPVGHYALKPTFSDGLIVTDALSSKTLALLRKTIFFKVIMCWRCEE